MIKKCLLMIFFCFALESVDVYMFFICCCGITNTVNYTKLHKLH